MSDNRESLWERYRHLLRRRTSDDVSDELRFHLEMRAEEGRRAGLSAREANAAALERFGEYQPVESEVVRIDSARERRGRRTEWFVDLRSDTAFAVRSLCRAPSFAIAAIATLAIAIGANASIYSVVHALLLARLPYAEPERLVTLWGSSTGELLLLREQLRSVSDIAAYGGQAANLDDGQSTERVAGVAVSANFFALFRSPPLVGRTLRSDENEPGKTDVIVLSEGLWRRRFAADSTVIGRRVLVDGSPTTVVGVMPNEFAFPSARVAFWKPFVVDRSNTLSLWTAGGHNFIARLRTGTTVDGARREVTTVALGMRHSNPIWDPGAAYGTNADVKPLRDALVGGTRPLLFLLLGCAFLILLIACVNVANLLLARASARQRELAIRAALGGGRSRLVRQMLTESIVVAAAGAALGVVLAAGGMRWLISALPPGTPRASEIAMNGPVLAFTAALTILTGVAFGLLPALRVTRESSANGIVRSGRTGHGVGHQRVSAMLVVAEVALAVLVVIGAELLTRSFWELRDVDPGFRTSHIVAARMTPPSASYAEPSRTNELYASVLSRAAALPGVSSVGAVSDLPLAGPVYGLATRIEGQFEDVAHGLPMISHFQRVTPAYFSTMNIRLLRGRTFVDSDRDGGQPVAVVSQSMAAHFWPGADPIGRRIGYPYDSPWITVVGVVADVRLDNLRDTSAMSAYVPFLQRAVHGGTGAELTVVVRTSGDPGNIEGQLRALVASVDRTVPLSDIRTMEDVVASSVAEPRFTMLLVGAFAVIALLLGTVGIYGVASYVVSERAQELGVRTALGATSGDILAMVLGRAALLAGAGAAVGTIAALLAVHPLRALLYGVSSSDPASYLAVPVLFVSIALAASLGPARRATRVSPTNALRSD
jgi:putative ABC transport system permease protein